MPTGHSDLVVSQLRLLSEMTLGCIKLTAKTSIISFLYWRIVSQILNLWQQQRKNEKFPIQGQGLLGHFAPRYMPIIIIAHPHNNGYNIHNEALSLNGILLYLRKGVRAECKGETTKDLSEASQCYSALLRHGLLSCGLLVSTHLLVFYKAGSEAVPFLSQGLVRPSKTCWLYMSMIVGTRRWAAVERDT